MKTKTPCVLTIVFLFFYQQSSAEPPTEHPAPVQKVKTGESQPESQPAHTGHHTSAPKPVQGWGKSLNGLRMRLFPVRKTYTAGETIDLVLLLQNVSDQPVELPAPSLMPTLANGDSHPYGEQHGYNTMASFHIPDGEVCILWARLESLQEARQTLRLKPRGLHILTIRIPPQAKLQQSVDSLTNTGRQSHDGRLTRETARFALATDPGQYILQARYHPDGLARQPNVHLREQTDPNRGDQLLQSNPTVLRIEPAGKQAADREVPVAQ